MGPLPPPRPPQTEEGPLSCSEEDEAEKALRFRVFTRKHESPGEPARLQHVVDKPIAWGPAIMPLSKLVNSTDKEAQSVHRSDIEGARDCFVLRGVMSAVECEQLVAAAEAQGFEYWGNETSNNSNSDGGSSTVSGKANNSYRSAHTVEVEHQDLANLIWVGRSLNAPDR